MYKINGLWYNRALLECLCISLCLWRAIWLMTMYLWICQNVGDKNSSLKDSKLIFVAFIGWSMSTRRNWCGLESQQLTQTIHLHILFINILTWTAFCWWVHLKVICSIHDTVYYTTPTSMCLCVYTSLVGLDQSGPSAMASMQNKFLLIHLATIWGD